MKPRSALVLPLFALVVLVGCASTKMTQATPMTTARIPRPDHIWVYDFIATPSEAPTDSDVTVQTAAQTPEQIAMGRELGHQIATQLAVKLQEMGLPGVAATSASRPQVGDVVIRGYLLSIDEGSAVKRLTIGFGSGGSELTTGVEGYLVTAQGLRKMGSGEIESGGSKTPGAALPAAVAIASGNPVGLIVSSGMKIYGEASGSAKVQGRAEKTAEEISDQLKVRAQAQGWIS